jgi:hypothetical protein
MASPRVEYRQKTRSAVCAFTGKGAGQRGPSSTLAGQFLSEAPEMCYGFLRISGADYLDRQEGAAGGAGLDRLVDVQRPKAAGAILFIAARLCLSVMAGSVRSSIAAVGRRAGAMLGRLSQHLCSVAVSAVSQY